MTSEEKIFADLDSETLKKQGMNAFEAMYAQLKAKDKYIAELEAIIADKKDDEVYWSPAGFMQAKQVGKYLGLRYGQVVSGRRLHKFLGVHERYNDWINRMLEYGFEENIDYMGFTEKTVKPKGGRPSKDHILTLDMAKELCMIQRSDIGRQARKYFIEVEKAYKKQSAIREAGKIARRGLTDVIRDEIPDSPHKKYVYGNFTDLIYKHVIGCSARQFRKKRGLDKKANIREYLSTEQIKAVDKYESLVKDLIRMGWEYEHKVLRVSNCIP